MEKILKEILTEIKNINGKMSDMDGRISKMDGKITQMDGRIYKVEGGLTKIEERLSNVESNLCSVKEQQVENTQLLKTLEHKANVHKAEIDNLTHGVADIQGDVSAIKSKLDFMDEAVTRNKLDIIDLRKAR